MKLKVVFLLQTLITGSLLCQSDDAFPIALSREFNAPEMVVPSQLNDVVSLSLCSVRRDYRNP